MNNPTETANASEPKLCKMGCGFFGSNATGDCCSKCFNALRKEQGTTPAPAQPLVAAAPVEEAIKPMSAPPEPAVVAPAPSVAEPAKKKKKKKTSYKNMLAGMMEGSGPRDVEKEKETIARVCGGGDFKKIDKI